MRTPNSEEAKIHNWLQDAKLQLEKEQEETKKKPKGVCMKGSYMLMLVLAGGGSEAAGQMLHAPEGGPVPGSNIDRRRWVVRAEQAAGCVSRTAAGRNGRNVLPACRAPAA